MTAAEKAISFRFCYAPGATTFIILRAMPKNAGRGLIEVGFILFLFYSNLLMGEFERSGAAQGRGLAWALSDIFTMANLRVGVVAAVIGYIVVEFLRARF